MKGPALSGWLPRAGRQLSASAAKCNSGDALQRWPWASGSALEVLVAGCTGAGVVVVGGGILGFGSACCGQGVGEHVGPKNATLGRRGRHCSRPRNATQPPRLHAAPHGTNHPPHVVGNDPACVHMGGGNQPVPHPLPALTRTVAPDSTMEKASILLKPTPVAFTCTSEQNEFNRAACGAFRLICEECQRGFTRRSVASRKHSGYNTTGGVRALSGRPNLLHCISAIRGGL